MQVIYNYCDSCGNVVKTGGKKYILGVNSVIQKVHARQQDFQEVYEQIYKKTQYRTIQIFEICGECKKVLEYLFEMRKEKLEGVKKELNKIMEQEEKKSERERKDEIL